MASTRPTSSPCSAAEHADRVAHHQHQLAPWVPQPRPAAAVRGDDVGETALEPLPRPELLPAAPRPPAEDAVVERDRHPQPVVPVARDRLDLAPVGRSSGQRRRQGHGSERVTLPLPESATADPEAAAEIAIDARQHRGGIEPRDDAVTDREQGRRRAASRRRPTPSRSCPPQRPAASRYPGGAIGVSLVSRNRSMPVGVPTQRLPSRSYSAAMMRLPLMPAVRENGMASALGRNGLRPRPLVRQGGRATDGRGGPYVPMATAGWSRDQVRA